MVWGVGPQTWEQVQQVEDCGKALQWTWRPPKLLPSQCGSSAARPHTAFSIADPGRLSRMGACTLAGSAWRTRLLTLPVVELHSLGWAHAPGSGNQSAVLGCQEHRSQIIVGSTVRPQQQLQ